MNKATQIKVLLADDSKEVKYLSDFIQLQEWHVSVARNGDQAIQELSETDFDAVLLDRNMPGQSGDMVLKWLHEEFVGVMPCVIMLTGHPAPESAAKAVEHSAYRYLIKPQSPDTIVSILRAGVARYRCKKMADTLLTSPKEDLFLMAKEILTSACGADLAAVVFVDPQRQVHEIVGHPTHEMPSRLRFVDRVLEGGGKLLYLKSRDDLRDMDPLLKEAGSLMAVPVRSDGVGYRGCLEMESLQENAFESHWADLLRQVASIIGLAALIRDRSIEASSALLYREFRHSTATHAQIIAMQSEQLRNADLPEVPDSDVRSKVLSRLDSISKHAEAIQTVVEDLRTATAELPQTFREMDLVSVLRAVVETACREDSAKQASVEFASDMPQVKLHGDRTWLEYAFACLVTNAHEAIQSEQSQATGEAGGKILVRVQTRGTEAVITVSDNGIGIPRELLDLIFQPLFSTKTRSTAQPFGLKAEFLDRFISCLTRAMIQHAELRSLPDTSEFQMQYGKAGKPDKLLVRKERLTDPIAFDVPPGEFSEKRGIGLYTVRRVVHMHGGTITAGSGGLHRGATFTITLPISEG